MQSRPEAIMDRKVRNQEKEALFQGSKDEVYE